MRWQACRAKPAQHARGLFNSSLRADDMNRCSLALLEGCQGPLAYLYRPELVAERGLLSRLCDDGIHVYVSMCVLYVCKGGPPRCGDTLRVLHAVLKVTAPATYQGSVRFAKHRGQVSTAVILLECYIVHMMMQDGHFCCHFISGGPLQTRIIRWEPASAQGRLPVDYKSYIYRRRRFTSC